MQPSNATVECDRHSYDKSTFRRPSARGIVDPQAQWRSAIGAWGRPGAPKFFENLKHFCKILQNITNYIGPKYNNSTTKLNRAPPNFLAARRYWGEKERGREREKGRERERERGRERESRDYRTAWCKGEEEGGGEERKERERRRERGEKEIRR